jgi:alpha-glucosidase
MRKVLWIPIFASFLLLMATQIAAQDIGRIVSYRKTKTGIIGRTTNAMFAITVWNENMVRVQCTRAKAFKPLPYALVSENGTGASFKIADQNDIITISTSQYTLQLRKDPFRVTMLDKNGFQINEAAEGTNIFFQGDAVTINRKIQPGEKFVGLGEALGDLDRRGTGVTLNNTDNYRYADPRVSMYSSIPFFIGVHHQKVYGLFFNNSYGSLFNFGMAGAENMSVTHQGGDADFFLISGESTESVVSSYSELTGHTPLPPKWAMGYHQSRCSYYPQDKVEWIAETFRKKKIPLDCIVLDADYLKYYEPFRINTDRFPGMKGLAHKLADMHIELTASVNPGIRIDSSYEAHADGIKQDVFLKHTDGKLYVADIPPNTNHFVDFTDVRGRNWWSTKMKFLNDNGIHGYWNDMNEPAVTGSYVPPSVKFSFDGRGATTAEAKNVYGMQMARSSYEAAIKYGEGRRPFNLTRSGFAGVQRYAALWSGDNMADDDGLLRSILLNNQLGLSGVGFCGYDVGGYIGNATTAQYKRWIQCGVFSPFCRNHREFFGAAGEPWAYGEEAEAISKAFIDFRYQLMPYLYSAFYQHTQTGTPIARPLCFDFPFDASTYDRAFQYQFLFGQSLLVLPVTSQEKTKSIYLPKGKWYHLQNDSLLSGDRTITQDVHSYTLPLFVKGGAIIPMHKKVQSTKEAVGDTLTIHVYKGDEVSSFICYEDNGDGLAYQSKKFARRTITFDPAQRKLLLDASEGEFTSVFKILTFVFHGFASDRPRCAVQVATLGKAKIFDPLGYLADIYDQPTFKALRSKDDNSHVMMLTLSNMPSKFEIAW